MVYEQDYIPKHNGVASKLSWEIEQQQLGYSTKSEIARQPLSSLYSSQVFSQRYIQEVHQLTQATCQKQRMLASSTIQLIFILDFYQIYVECQLLIDLHIVLIWINSNCNFASKFTMVVHFYFHFNFKQSFNKCNDK